MANLTATTKPGGKPGQDVDVPEQAKVSCAFCKGTGLGPFHTMPSVELKTCQVCHGSKTVYVNKPYETCQACGGTGAATQQNLVCRRCRGKGLVPKIVKDETQQDRSEQAPRTESPKPSSAPAPVAKHQAEPHQGTKAGEKKREQTLRQEVQTVRERHRRENLQCIQAAAQERKGRRHEIATWMAGFQRGSEARAVSCRMAREQRQREVRELCAGNRDYVQQLRSKSRSEIESIRADARCFVKDLHDRNPRRRGPQAASTEGA